MTDDELKKEIKRLRGLPPESVATIVDTAEDLLALLEELNYRRQMHDDHQRNTRQVDIALNGDQAVPQASLCDLIPQAALMRAELEAFRALGRNMVPGPHGEGEEGPATPASLEATIKDREQSANAAYNLVTTLRFDLATAIEEDNKSREIIYAMSEALNPAGETNVEAAKRVARENADYKRVLADGTAVFVNLMRGTIARPTNTQLLGLLGNIESKALRHLLHPQIHIDYYEWLESIKKDPDDFSRRFIADHSRNMHEFSAIAMWAWSRSRETIL
jgi:hypothetical protein